AAAVIGHADQVRPALLHVDVDARGPGVDAVFQQLLEDAGRALDHFAGGDLGDDGLRQLLDTRHEWDLGHHSTCSPHFLILRWSVGSLRLRFSAAFSRSPPASVRAVLILSCTFQSWMTRYSVRSPMPSFFAASSRLPWVISRVFSM